MENIGDKDSAIAERVRALLAAANATAGPSALPAPVAAAAAPSPTPPARLRVDPRGGSGHSDGQSYSGRDPAGCKLILFLIQGGPKFLVQRFMDPDSCFGFRRAESC